MKYPKSKKFKWLIVAITLLLAIIGGVFWMLKPQAPTINIEIYGTSIDPVMSQVEAVMVSAMDYFEKDIKVNFNYLVLKDESGNYKSLQAQAEDISEASLKFDLAENKRKLVIQKYYPEKFKQYLIYRSSSYNNQDWQPDLLALGLDINEIMNKVELEGNQLLDESISKASDLLNTNSEISQLPLVMINNQIYRSRYQAVDLFADIAKVALRGEKAVLPDPEDNSWELFNGLIAVNKPGNSYQYKGINECYSDKQCIDKKDFDGVCLDIGLETAHCAYYQPASISLNIIVDQQHDLANDQIVNNFKSENKGLEVNLVRYDTPESKKIIEALGEVNYPVYVFDNNISQSRYFEFYQDEGIVIQKNNYYIFNPSYLGSDTNEIEQ